MRQRAISSVTVWRRGHPAAASHGHSRPADHATLTVAERACRTADWLDPTRVSRPCVVLGQRHLRHLFANYATYYNRVRTHLALDKDAPLHRPAQTVGLIASVTWLGGLHRHYVRMA